MGRCRSRHRLAAGRKVAIAMTTRLVLMQGGRSSAQAIASLRSAARPLAPQRTERSASMSSATSISKTTNATTETGWVVPRPQRWTTPYSTPSERATRPNTAHRLRDDLSPVSALLDAQSCAACDARHPSSCVSLGFAHCNARPGQARDEGEPPACA